MWLWTRRTHARDDEKPLTVYRECRRSPWIVLLWQAVEASYEVSLIAHPASLVWVCFTVSSWTTWVRYVKQAPNMWRNSRHFSTFNPKSHLEIHQTVLVKYWRNTKLQVFTHVVRFLMHVVFFLLLLTLLQKHLNAHVHGVTDDVYIWSLKSSNNIRRIKCYLKAGHNMQNQKNQRDLTSFQTKCSN